MNRTLSILSIFILCINSASSAMQHDEHLALIKAVKSNQASKVKKLIAAYYPLDIQNGDGSTALMLALEANHTNIARTLIKAGANLNLSDISGATALSCAIYANNAEITRLLVKAQAAFILVGFTPLLYAIGMNRPDMVRVLIQAGADITLADELFNFTPLQSADYDAVKIARQETIPLTLIFAGALPHKHLINYKRYLPVYNRVFTLAKQVFNPKDPSSLREIKALAKKYIFIDPVDAAGNTPLHYAVLSGNRVMLTVLLYLMAQAQRAASVTHKNNDGYTPVELAVVKSPYWIWPILRKAAITETVHTAYEQQPTYGCVCF